MWSDKNTEELLDIALKIGMKPEWLQQSRRGFIHFDLTSSRRESAIKKGAVEITWKEYLKQRKK